MPPDRNPHRRPRPSARNGVTAALAPDVLRGRRMFVRVVGVMLVLGLAGCAKQDAPAPVAAPEKADLSEAARREAVAAAVAKQFEETVRAPFLERGVTVRGLARAAARGDRKVRGKLSPAKYDASASASAKVELVNKRIVYTASAQADDPAAAVIEHGAERWVLSWEVEAELTPDGELGELTFLRVGEPRRLSVTAGR